MAGGITGGLAGALGCFAGLFIDPDLDVDRITRSERRMIKTVGLAGWLWLILWWPYARVIPHRHPLSHWPVLSTALRLVYLAGLVFLVLFGLEVAFGLGMPLLVMLMEVPRPVWLAAFSGLALSDVGHWLADYLRFRRMRRWRWSRRRGAGRRWAARIYAVPKAVVRQVNPFK
jgi:uncharacterized metal-binding protein